MVFEYFLDLFNDIYNDKNLLFFYKDREIFRRNKT
jgi:hypothetical protein